MLQLHIIVNTGEEASEEPEDQEESNHIRRVRGIDLYYQLEGKRKEKKISSVTITGLLTSRRECQRVEPRYRLQF